MNTLNTAINEQLHALAESDYKAFNQRIISTNYDTLGIRLPALKKLAKEIATSADVDNYLQTAVFDTYEHILLYGLVLGHIKKPTLEIIFRYLDPLILKFDNWAHVDTIISALKILKKYPQEAFEHFLPLKTDQGEFTKRVFVIFLMDYFMTDANIDSALKHLSEVPQGQYYVDMGIAWALSYGLVKHYDKTVAYLEQQAFSKFVHNKAIQKARESFRITSETKELLNKMKIK